MKYIYDSNEYSTVTRWFLGLLDARIEDSEYERGRSVMQTPEQRLRSIVKDYGKVYGSALFVLAILAAGALPIAGLPWYIETLSMARFWHIQMALFLFLFGVEIIMNGGVFSSVIIAILAVPLLIERVLSRAELPDISTNKIWEEQSEAIQIIVFAFLRVLFKFGMLSLFIKGLSLLWTQVF